MIPDPASFRDPQARIYRSNGRVFRFYNAAGAAGFTSLQTTGLPDRLCHEGKLISSITTSPATLPHLPTGEPAPSLIVEHPKIPLLTYPYEWSFEMLRDAALLQLDLLDAALPHGFLLQDATPYNVQFAGPRPIHIDVGSFLHAPEAPYWPAYSQFCRLFLYPLVLMAKTDVPFHPWLRGRAEGITPQEIASLIPWHRRWFSRLWIDVALHARLDRFARRESGLHQPSIDAQQSRRTLQRTSLRLRSIINRLPPPSDRRDWKPCEDDSPCAGAARDFKERFVAETIQKLSPKTLWDLGCGVGRYALAAAAHAHRVVAVDSDPLAIDRLYREAQRRNLTNVIPLVADILDPSPAAGWENREREPLLQRESPDLCIVLALLHHLRLRGNLPWSLFFGWLSRFTPRAIVEYVGEADPAIGLLIRGKQGVPADYARPSFEAEIRRHFRIESTTAIPGTDRTLYVIAR